MALEGVLVERVLQRRAVSRYFGRGGRRECVSLPIRRRLEEEETAAATMATIASRPQDPCSMRVRLNQS